MLKEATIPKLIRFGQLWALGGLLEFSNSFPVSKIPCDKMKKNIPIFSSHNFFPFRGVQIVLMKLFN